MKLGHVLQTRPAWWDRNPVLVGNSYNVTGVAPHGLTTRWVYTVPTGKKALLTAAVAVLLRDAAATTAALTFVTVLGTVTISGMAVYASIWDATLGARVSQNVGQGWLLSAAAGVEGRTRDNSTGGTVHYTVTADLVEFDA